MKRLMIVYDVTDNRRRRLLSDLLEGYGKRVNRSVFECLFSSEAKYLKLQDEIREIVNKKEDSVRLYELCLSCIEKSKGLCDEPDPFEKDAIYFF